MNKIELNKIFKILSEADSGCSVCVRELFKLFIKEFPKNKEDALAYLKTNKIIKELWSNGKDA